MNVCAHTGASLLNINQRLVYVVNSISTGSLPLPLERECEKGAILLCIICLMALKRHCEAQLHFCFSTCRWFWFVLFMARLLIILVSGLNNVR